MKEQRITNAERVERIDELEARICLEVDGALHRPAVRLCDAVAVCLSRKGVDREGYIHKEITIALDIAEAGSS